MSYCCDSYPKNEKATKTSKEAAGAASSGGRMQGGGKIGSKTVFYIIFLNCNWVATRWQ